MTTALPATQLRIWRHGGIAGITRVATVTDMAVISRIQTELVQVNISRPPRLPDMFQYVFEAQGGSGDANFHVERHLPENALPTSLLSLLRELTFDPPANKNQF